MSDTVYRADGTLASGTLLISWPEFTTADGYAVVAGTKSVPLLIVPHGELKLYGKVSIRASNITVDFSGCKGHALMDWIAKLLHGLSFLPAVVDGIDGLFDNRSGQKKKSAALSFLEATLSISDALSNRQITDEAKFKEGLSRMIDGGVLCLNASAWTKQDSAAAK